MNPQTPSPQVPPPTNNVSLSQQVIERLKTANNVLVTVSNNPTVDQLAACIGFTLVLNKLDKHGTAVFSGEVPPAISFLEPDKLLEKNTDSLRDFIIALDKSKADKLRYKIEDKFVKIFITPYRTSIDEKDLEFSHGDFNVDVVLALGVHQRAELDQAITAHGRILHDATVITINNDKTTDIGVINWREENVSSLSEMMVTVTEGIKEGLLDPAIATAFLTGIVAETERFSNGKTKAQTMSISARLMSAGAHQQLIATKLEPPKPVQPAPMPAPPPPPAVPTTPPTTVAKTEEAELPKPDDGSLYIPHEREEKFALAEDEIHIDDEGTLRRAKEIEEQKLRDQDKKNENARPLVEQPPSTGGTLIANIEPKPLDGSADALSKGYGADNTLLRRPPVNSIPYQPAATSKNDNDDQTLEDLEKSVHSPHVGGANSDTNSLPSPASDNEPDYLLEPIKGLNSKPVNLDTSSEIKDVKEIGFAPQVNDPTAPPPVPPPMTPPSYLPPSESDQKGSMPPDVPL